jgi:hypothetical protein
VLSARKYASKTHALTLSNVWLTAPTDIVTIKFHCHKSLLRNENPLARRENRANKF